MPTAEFADVQEFLIECDGCEGTGKPRVQIGNMDHCVNCGGRGQKTVRLRIPKPGDKVKVKIGNQPMLNDLFGLYETGQKKDQPKVTHDSVGTVFDVQPPEKHLMELRTGVGVRVDFNNVLTNKGAIPKGKTVDLFVFDLYELKIV